MQQSFNLEQASMASENLKNTAIAVDAMRDANKTLKSQYKKMNLDKIEAVQDEMEDLLEQANEVQETLGRSYALGDEVDEDDLEAELDALGDELDFEEEGEPSYLQETPLNLPSTGTAEPTDVRWFFLPFRIRSNNISLNIQGLAETESPQRLHA
jgi:charged multivesicular body protein 5